MENSSVLARDSTHHPKLSKGVVMHSWAL